MHKHVLFIIIRFLEGFKKEFREFLIFFFQYCKKKVLTFSYFFEKNKNILVHFFMMKRGRYNRPFLHMATIGVLALGVLLAPLFAESFPVFSEGQNKLRIGSPQQQQSVIAGEDVFQTQVSQKPRSTIVTYTVQKGDTIATIAKKFSQPNNPISENTIRWANDLTNDNLSVGDTLKILPVTGVAHKVAKGETVKSIADTYAASSQAIVDFPFNDFANPETFSLVEGQILIVPDGIKPTEQPYIKREVYIAQGPIAVSSSGFTWPIHGSISQFASWYHMALDITSPIGTPVAAARSGVVVEASGGWSYGYGNHVIIDHGDGTKSLYAHMQSLNVGVGQSVTGGKTLVGWVGLTGRTTGAHLHFEIRKGDVATDPLPYLQ